jgi:hypothetical protein
MTCIYCEAYEPATSLIAGKPACIECTDKLLTDCPEIEFKRLNE